MKTLLRRLVARQLERRVQKLIRDKKVKVVAITGSVGKTSTKLAIATVLRQKYRVLAHPGNFNSEIGLPLSVFEIDLPGTLVNPLVWLKVLDQMDKQLKSDYPYDVIVLEMGADHPGEIKHFMEYITPDIGLVTAIAPVHIEGFGSVDAIAEEKMALARGSKAVWLNAEDERVMQEASQMASPIQTYGLEVGEVHWAHVARDKELKLSGSITLNEGEIQVKTQLIGRHGLVALAAAAAVGEELGLSHEEIQRGIEGVQPVSGRMQLLRGHNDSVIIDDTYNSSPRSAIAALRTLEELPGRHIAVLGTMNEMGELAEEGHREVGEAAAKVDMLVTIGDLAQKYLVAGAAQAGVDASKIHSFTSPYGAGRFLQKQLKKGDVVLAKGSQNGVFAEEAIALCLANDADRQKLVRQSPEWQARKRQQFTDAAA